MKLSFKEIADDSNANLAANDPNPTTFQPTYDGIQDILDNKNCCEYSKEPTGIRALKISTMTPFI